MRGAEDGVALAGVRGGRDRARADRRRAGSGPDRGGRDPEQRRAAGPAPDPGGRGTGSLLSRYDEEATWLRGYVTSSRPGSPAPFAAAERQVAANQADVRTLVRGYPAITAQLEQTIAAHQAWLAKVAGPQLAAIGRGDLAAARAQQNDIAVDPSLSGGHPFSRGPPAEQHHHASSKPSPAGSPTPEPAHRRPDRHVRPGRGHRGRRAGGGLVRPAAAVRTLRTATRPWRPVTTARRSRSSGPHELKALGRSTELMRMQLVAALSAREQAEFRFRQLFDAAPDAMIAVEWDGSVTMANTQAVRLFGYPAGEFIGRASGDAGPGGDAGRPGRAADPLLRRPGDAAAADRAEDVRAAPGRQQLPGRDHAERAADRERHVGHRRHPGRLRAAGPGQGAGTAAGRGGTGAHRAPDCSRPSGWRAWASWWAGSRTTSTTCST